MIIGNPTIVELDQFLAEASESELLKSLNSAKFSLAAALSSVLALAEKYGDEESKLLINRLNLPELLKVSNYYGRQSFNADREFRGSSCGFWPIRCGDDVASEKWSVFRDRFRIAASRGSRQRIFFGLAGVLHEMADNVPSHAFRSGDKFQALAGYHIYGDCISFSVADRGGGFLASLLTKQEWCQLGSQCEALLAVIDKHATSRPGEREGGGFKQLFNTLLDMNGLVFLRSGNCLVQMQNHGETRRRRIFDKSGGCGAQITVVISRKGEPTEIPLEIT